MILCSYKDSGQTLGELQLVGGRLWCDKRRFARISKKADIRNEPGTDVRKNHPTPHKTTNLIWWPGTRKNNRNGNDRWLDFSNKHH